MFIVSISLDGEYSVEGGSFSFTFRCDGKDRPIGSNRTRACVKSSATALDLIQKENGVKTNAYRWELSAGRDVLTATGTAFRPSGPVMTSQMVASRVSGSNDFAGQWQDRSYLQQHADMTLRLDGQALHISYPRSGQYMDAPLDGADAVVHGPFPPGVTYTARLVGRREIFTLARRDGKAVIEESFELSADGRVITESWWNPARPTDRDTLVYEKN
jgi:hypothetical protein